jgi:DNA polymerase-4
VEIKKRMKKEVGDYLTCSIGIAENKLLAKIASDLKKPDGIVLISNIKFQISNGVLNLTKEDLYTRLKLTDIPGIAKRQEKKVKRTWHKNFKRAARLPFKQTGASVRHKRIPFAPYGTA